MLLCFGFTAENDTSTHQSNETTQEESSTEYAHKSMQANGFQHKEEQPQGNAGLVNVDWRRGRARIADDFSCNYITLHAHAQERDG